MRTEGTRPVYEGEKNPLSVSTNSLCIVIVVDVRKIPLDFTAISTLGTCGAASRDARLALIAAVAVHRTLVLRANRYAGVNSSGIHKGGTGGTPTPPKHCAGLSNNKGPHTHICLHHRPGANQSGETRGTKKKEKRKTQERHPTRESRGEGRGPGPPAHVKRADLPHSPNPYKLACTVRAHPTGNRQSPGASRGRGPKGTHGSSRSEISF